MYSSQKEIKFIGKITDNDPSCHSDAGLCRVKVDNFWITTSPVGSFEEQRTGPIGKVINKDGFISQNVGNIVLGESIEVYARKIDSNHLTLSGKKSYYIKFIVDQ